MARVDTLPHFLTDVADAIRTKAGTSGAIQASAFDTAIANIPSGGGTVEPNEKDVNFYDYDGTRVHSYTAQEFLALENMPENPTHEGLTADGWNWSLTNAKNYVTNHGSLDIGQTYRPTDGKTKIYIHLEDGRTKPYLRFAVNGSVVVDWGDGGGTQTITGTSTSTFLMTPHEYASGGDYVITLDSQANIYLSTDNSTYAKIITGENGYTSTPFQAYLNSVKKLILSPKIVFGTWSFSYMNGLETISIPDQNSTSATGLFSNCYSLKNVVIPKSMTTAGNQMFAYCFSLERAIFSDSITTCSNACFRSDYSLQNVNVVDRITTLPDNFFYETHNLKKLLLPTSLTTMNNYSVYQAETLTKVIIPAGLTTMNYNIFYYTTGISCYDFSACTQIPTMQSGCFSAIASDAKIVVPDDLYNSWITTSGWNSYASYIISKSDWDDLQA